MKKIILILLSILMFTGCFNGYDGSKVKPIPEKYDVRGVNIESSSITTKNIDEYLFREDSVYVDLRPYSEIVREGHIAGFSFYPFYDFIASLENTKDSEGNPYDNRLFVMENKKGMIGQIGTFSPNYEESELILNKLFSKDKYIFAITISCNETMYFFNLLIQYGYDSSKLYNVGGFSIGTGFENIAYINIDNPKYLVKGNPTIGSIEDNTTFDFMNELTPINKGDN